MLPPALHPNMGGYRHIDPKRSDGRPPVGRRVHRNETFVGIQLGRAEDMATYGFDQWHKQRTRSAYPSGQRYL